MSNFLKKLKSNWQYYIKPLAALALLGISIWLLVINAKLYKKQKELSKERKEYTQEIQGIQKENDNLKEKIANYDDTDYIEKVAREENNMQKPGETVVSFVVPDTKETAPAKKSLLDSFLDFLADLF